MSALQDVQAAGRERSPCRILHLEDSAIDADLIAAHLARSGLSFTAQRVSTRDTYIAALAAGGVDLVLADYDLPDFDGLAALALARETVPDVPFIFVSGTLGEEEAVEAVKRGATDYVVKGRLARLPVAIQRALAEARTKAEGRRTTVALRESEARLRLALEAGRLEAWELDLRDPLPATAAACRANPDRTPVSCPACAEPCAAIHLDDRERMWAAIARSVVEDVDCDVEYRVVQPNGEVRWVQVRGRPVRAEDGTATGMAGVSLDVTERKLAEERQALLSREVDHRAKNALAVVQAMLRLTRAADTEAYVRTVEGRVAALARAQTLLAEDRWTGADLHALLAGELAPFLGGDERRAVLDGERVLLPATAAQPLAMAVHELATNAVKYGALSTAEGRVSVSWGVERERGEAVLRLRWMERGGPPVAGPPSRRGFGGRVLDATVRGQLGGEVSLSWERAGLVCELELPLAPAPQPTHSPSQPRLQDA